MALRKFRKLEEGSSKFSNIRQIRKKQMNDTGMCIFSKDGLSSPFYIIVWELFTIIITRIVVIKILNQFAIFVGASRFTYSKCLHIIVVVNRNGAPSFDTCGHLHITEAEKQIISLLFIRKMITKYGTILQCFIQCLPTLGHCLG